MRVRFDRFYTYAELTETLEAWAEAFPGLLRVETIGQSYEGRDIPLVTVTSLETGPPEEKPAVFVHAQIHAMEFTGTTAALHLIDRLLHEHGEDERVTFALDTRTFYVVPRVNPDGADAGLADGRWRRSSVRPYPFDEPKDGLHREDVDGDGRVLYMRQRDPNGSWKPHPEDPRLLVARRPDDVEGEFFRVYAEGTIRNWDGVTVPIAPVLEGLDLNRNWPADWAPEGEQVGAGPYPASEPEVRALVQAIVSAIGDGAHRLLLVLENAGWLPTNVTQKALDRKAVQPIEVSLELPEDARIVTGKEREEVGQLGGRVEDRSVIWWGVDHSTKNRAKVEWVLEAPAGTRVGVVARHERAGTVRAELTLSPGL